MKTTTKIFGPEDFGHAAAVLGLDAMMDRLIERLDTAFRDYDPQMTPVPARAGFSYETPVPGLIEWMPVMARGRHALMKLVSYHPRNPDTVGLPTILSSFALIDVKTGHMEAICDGTFLTALRTGAASAVATRLLAHPDSRSLGLIGCGAQAVTQLHALSRSQTFDVVLYWDTDAKARSSFPGRVARFLPPGAVLRESPLALMVPNVDVLCTATSIDVGRGPLFDGLDTREWLHVNAVGSDFPGKIELPVTLLRDATVIPDFAQQALIEGECQQLSADDPGPELHALLRSGPDPSLRESRSVFDSTGWALEDLVAMELLFEWSQALGLGREVELETLPEDPRDPYRFALPAAEERRSN